MASVIFLHLFVFRLIFFLLSLPIIPYSDTVDFLDDVKRKTNSLTNKKLI